MAIFQLAASPDHWEAPLKNRTCLKGSFEASPRDIVLQGPRSRQYILYIYVYIYMNLYIYIICTHPCGGASRCSHSFMLRHQQSAEQILHPLFQHVIGIVSPTPLPSRDTAGHPSLKGNRFLAVEIDIPERSGTGNLLGRCGCDENKSASLSQFLMGSQKIGTSSFLGILLCFRNELRHKWLSI